jgi:hypothetical protein
MGVHGRAAGRRPSSGARGRWDTRAEGREEHAAPDAAMSSDSSTIEWMPAST